MTTPAEQYGAIHRAAGRAWDAIPATYRQPARGACACAAHRHLEFSEADDAA